jgi:hypothetical protein
MAWTCHDKTPSAPPAHRSGRVETGLLGEPRTVRTATEPDGTTIETHLRSDGTVTLRATFQGERAQRVAALGPTGNVAWQCELPQAGEPKCAIFDDSGRPFTPSERDEMTLSAMQRYQRARRTLSGEALSSQMDDHGHEDRPQPSPQATSAWEEKRQGTWKNAEPYFRRVDELLTLGFPILIAPTLAKEELSTGTFLVPRRVSSGLGTEAP